jgi:hypothetical protein
MFFLEFFQGIYTFFITEPSIALGRLLLVALGLLFIYLSYKKVLEALIMLPLGIGMIAVNAGLMVMEAGNVGTLFVNPLAGNLEEIMYYLQIDFLQPVYNFMFSNGLIACLVFMGIGAITDIDILLAKPGMSLFLAIFAELGTIATLPIAMGMGLLPNEAAAIALVGGADGPMVLYGSLMMAKDLFVPITVVAYVYLGICYAGYPFLARIIPRRMRETEMDWKTIPQVSGGAKFAGGHAAVRLFLSGTGGQGGGHYPLRRVPLRSPSVRRDVLPGLYAGCAARRGRYPRPQGPPAAGAGSNRPDAFGTGRHRRGAYFPQDIQRAF